MSKEDVTTPGTGLGMSIVKQLIDIAGGTIDVRSDLGKGTQVRLSLPLENQQSPSVSESIILNSPSISTEDPILTIRRRAQGRTVSLQGFDIFSGVVSLQSQSLASLKASIGKYICDWFKLRIIPDEPGSDTHADFVIWDESTFSNLPIGAENKLLSHTQAVLILCSSGAYQRTYATTMDNQHTIEFVSKPCGPRRLAKALLHCLEKEDINKFNARKASLGDLDASTKKQRADSHTVGTILQAAHSRKGVITAEDLTDIGNSQSSEGSPPPAVSFNIDPREDTTRERSSIISSSPNNSSKSDMKQASSTSTGSRDRSSSGNTTPSSSTTSITKEISPNLSSTELTVRENHPLPRRKMLLVEVRTNL